MENYLAYIKHVAKYNMKFTHWLVPTEPKELLYFCMALNHATLRYKNLRLLSPQDMTYTMMTVRCGLLLNSLNNKSMKARIKRQCTHFLKNI
jgi:hypothetical protein